MKKSLAVILAVIMICSALCACSKEDATSTATPDATAPQVTQEPTATFAPDVEIEYDEKLFTIEDTTLVKYLGNEETVTVPSGVSVIGRSAFENCAAVKTISLPDTLITIEDYAFAGCASIAEIVLPKSLVAISDYAFSKCTALTKIALPAKTVDIGEGIFAECTELAEAELSASTKDVPEKAFYGCAKLKSISIPGATKSIGASAFEGCKELSDVTIAKGVTTIGNKAFYGCAKLGATGTGDKVKYDIDIPNSIISIGIDAFEGTNWLSDSIKAAQETEVDSADRFIVLGKHGYLIKYVLADASAVKAAITEGNVFTGKNIVATYNADSVLVNSLIIPSRVKSISGGSFDGLRDKIESIDLSDSGVENINAAAFANMTNLKTFKFTEKTTVISDELFKGCTNLETVIINDNFTEIGNSAFEGCSKLTNIGKELDKDTDKSVAENNKDATEETVDAEETAAAKLSRSITTIGSRAFAGCASLKSIVLSDSLTSIGEYCFEGCSSVEKIEIGPNVTHIGVKAFDGTVWFDKWAGEGEVKTLVVGDGILIKSLDGTIPEGVKAIAAYTFAAKSEITEKEFYNSKLPLTITIPGTVTKIADNAFYYATNLQTVIIEEGVKEIGQKAFYGCSALTSVKIPSSVKQISDYTFYNCTSLVSIELPDSITKIGNYAFFNCLSLEDVKYKTGIQIGEEAFTNTNVITVK